MRFPEFRINNTYFYGAVTRSRVYGGYIIFRFGAVSRILKLSGYFAKVKLFRKTREQQQKQQQQQNVRGERVGGGDTGLGSDLSENNYRGIINILLFPTLGLISVTPV